MTTQPRNIAVQVPGDTAEVPPTAEESTGASASGKAPEAAKAPRTAAKAKVEDRPSRSQYRKMRAEDIDPATLSAAVLSADGWVCPAPVAKK